MRDPKRIEQFCKVLQKKWEEVPDWRFGQFMSNFFGDVLIELKMFDIFFIEDDVMLKMLEKYMSKEDEDDG